MSEPINIVADKSVSLGEAWSKEIQSFLEGEVSFEEEVLSSHSQDASIFEIRPELVVFPKNSKDVKALVRWATTKKEAGENISLTARSAGTDMSGGSINDSIIVDFSRHMNAFISLRVDEDGQGGIATAQPGMFYRDFEQETMKENLFMPSYPASRDICAIGGMVANNSGGEKTLAYGKTEKYVEKLKMVLADGEEYEIQPISKKELEAKIEGGGFEGRMYEELFRLLLENKEILKSAKPNVSKNSAGYYLWNVWREEDGLFDLPKLIVGSQGTLGFVTEITFRLVKKKKHSRMLVMFLPDEKNLPAIVNETLKFNPESLESYDDKTLNLAIRFFPDLLKRMKTGVFSLGLQFLPEFFMLLRGGWPKMVILAEITGDDEKVVVDRLQQLKSALGKFKVPLRILRSEQEGKKYWTIRRESFSLLRKHVRGRHTAPFIDDMIVRPEYLSEFLPAINAILEPHKKKMTYTIAGHDGDGNFHIIPLMDFKDPETRKLIPVISEQVYDLVLKYNGSITAEHNDGLIRTPYLEKMYGSKIVSIFANAKDIFDPLNIFNPRKKVNPDMDYALKHIKKA